MLSAMNFENYTVVASALVAEQGRRARLTRVPDTGVQVQLLPSARGGVDAVGRRFGSLVKSRITRGFYP